MARAENAEKVRRYFEIWSSEGLDAFLKGIPGDVEWHPYSAHGRKLWGSDELRTFLDGLAARGGRLDAEFNSIEELDEDNVLALGRMWREDGEPVEVAWLYSFRDGKLWRVSGHATTQEARQAARFLHTDRVQFSREGPNFSVTLHEEPRGRTVVEPAGELDLGTTEELAGAIARAARSGHVLVDLSRLEFMDSSGLRTLLEAAKAARDDGWRLELRRGTETVQRVIAMAGAERLLPFED